MRLLRGFTFDYLLIHSIAHIQCSRFRILCSILYECLRASGVSHLTIVYASQSGNMCPFDAPFKARLLRSWFISGCKERSVVPVYLFTVSNGAGAVRGSSI